MDVDSKPNSFTYVLPTTCYPKKKKKHKQCPTCIALWLKRNMWCRWKVWQYNNCCEEYKSFLIARDYKPRLVDKQFGKVEIILRNNARRRNTKNKEVSKVQFITTFKPALPSK